MATKDGDKACYLLLVESYEKIKKMVGDDDKIVVRLVEREELEQMIQQPEQYSNEDDEYLATNIFPATIEWSSNVSC